MTVYSVLWGDKYTPDYVYRLRDAVRDNLTIDHQFICVTDQDIDCNTNMPIVPWHGWWQKLSLFKMAHGPSLYFDLDSVIVGNLDYLASYAQNILSAPANWGQSGHGGIQSSVLAWSGEYKAPFDTFDYEKDSERLWGDQEYLTEITGNRYTPIPHVYSYKYHCRTAVPDDAAVVTFHGKPDYHECNDAWILKYMQTYDYRTS